MYCQHCGSKLFAGDRFCSMCGARVPEPEESSPLSREEAESFEDFEDDVTLAGDETAELARPAVSPRSMPTPPVPSSDADVTIPSPAVPDAVPATGVPLVMQDPLPSSEHTSDGASDAQRQDADGPETDGVEAASETPSATGADFALPGDSDVGATVFAGSSGASEETLVADSPSGPEETVVVGAADASGSSDAGMTAVADERAGAEGEAGPRVEKAAPLFPLELDDEATQALEFLSSTDLPPYIDGRAFVPPGSGPTGAVSSDAAQEPEPEKVASGEPAGEDEQKGKGAHRGRRRIAIAIIALLVVALCAGGWYVASQLLEKRAWNRAHTPVPVSISITAPGYNSSTDSLIPLQVTGTDSQGETVDRKVFVNSDGTGLELVPGSYQVTCAASPLMASGQLYALPDGATSLEVTPDGTSPGEISITYTVKSPSKITDDDINDAYQAALAGGMSSSQADDLRAAVIAARASSRGTSRSSSSSTGSSARSSGASSSADSSSSASTSSPTRSARSTESSSSRSSNTQSSTRSSSDDDGSRSSDSSSTGSRSSGADDS